MEVQNTCRFIYDTSFLGIRNGMYFRLMLDKYSFTWKYFSAIFTSIALLLLTSFGRRPFGWRTFSCRFERFHWGFCTVE